MSKPEISIVDAMTNEQIVREMTTAEFNAHKEYIEKIEAEKVAKEADNSAKAAQRQALLSRLGITEEEARILLGGN